MKLPLSLLIQLITMTNLLAQGNSHTVEYDKRNPFDKVRYVDNHPCIQVEGSWCSLTHIAGIPIDQIMKTTKETYPRDWKKGFHRYLHYTLDDLQMVRKDSMAIGFSMDGVVKTKNFPLLLKNRDLATVYHDSIVQSKKVTRVYHTNFPDDLNYLNFRRNGYEKNSDNWLTRDEAIHDLDYLEWEINNNYSYRGSCEI